MYSIYFNFLHYFFFFNEKQEQTQEFCIMQKLFHKNGVYICIYRYSYVLIIITLLLQFEKIFNTVTTLKKNIITCYKLRYMLNDQTQTQMIKKGQLYYNMKFIIKTELTK